MDDLGRAQAVNDAVAAEQCHWRAAVADLQATILRLETSILFFRTFVAILAEENEKLRCQTPPSG